MLRGLRHHPSAVVEALASGAAGDLLEVADLEVRDLAAVELGERGEQHRADRDVDADPQRVGAGDDLEQPLLGELLDGEAVLRQQPRVMDADAERQETSELTAVRRLEATSPSASVIVALSCFVVSGSEVSFWASSAQSRWVKLTM